MTRVIDDNEQVEDPTDEQDEPGAAIRYVIRSYGADYPVDSLVAKMDRKDIFIPSFQRNFVWNVSQASRFVESLLLGLPVPGVFLFKDPELNRLMVVGGQQRLRTLQAFYKGVFNGRPFRLTSVAPEYDGKTYERLDHTDRRRLDNAIIHAAVIQQSEPGDDRSSIYSVFERLNTGGSPLQPQEIRAALYRGGLNDLLSELAVNEHWQQLYRASRAKKKDEEIILRFLALYHSLGEYQRPMKKFLNDFMNQHREPEAIRRERGCGDISSEDENRLAQLAAIWASGYLEATCRELLLEYARRRAQASVVGYVGWYLDRVRSPNIGRMTDEIRKFDPEIARELRQFAQGRIGDSINSIVSMRHNVAHARPPDMSLDSISGHFDEAREFVAKMEELLIFSADLAPLPLPEHEASFPRNRG